MTPAWLISLVLFSFAMAATPGPNNVLMAASGLAHGFIRTIPLMMGTLAGIAALFLLCGTGVGAVIVGHPDLRAWLRAVGIAYVFYLAWRLWRSGGPGEARERPPLGFWYGLAFQFANPKAWMMTISAVSMYAASGENYAAQLLLVAGVFLACALPSIALWAACGGVLKTVLREGRHMAWLHRGMAVLTAASALLFMRG